MARQMTITRSRDMSRFNEAPVQTVPLDPVMAPYGALLLRVILGAMFLLHLYWKLQVSKGGADAWWASFATAGFPKYSQYYIISAEVVGGLLLIPGIMVRLAALYTLPLMGLTGYFWYAHKVAYFAPAPGELPILWGALLLVMALLGDGAGALRPSGRA